MTYTIIEKVNGRIYPYFDPFTSKVFEGTKEQAQKIAFMLGYQQNGCFEIEELKK